MAAIEAIEAKAARATALAMPMPDRLPAWQLVMLGLPTVPLYAVVLPVSFFLPAYMTGELGISLSAWAGIAIASRIIDMVLDPVAGVVCDRLPSRWGRRRHWLVIAAPALMLACAMLFMPRYFTQHVTVVYAFGGLTMLNLAQAVFSLNSYAWGAELSEDYDERSRIMGWRLGVAGLAPLLALGVPALIERMSPQATTGDKLYWVAVVFLVLMPLSLFLAAALVGERPNRLAVKPKAERMSFAQSWAAIVTNKMMLRLIAIEVMGLLPFAISSAVNVFYVTFVLRAPGVTATTLLFAFAGGLASMPVWMRLAQTFEKHRLLMIAYLCAPLAVIPQAFLGPGDVVPYIFIVAITGVFTSGPAFILRAMIADVVDTDVLETGEQRTGTFYAIVAMTQKLIPTVAVALAFPFLQLMGFDPASKTNTPEAINSLRLVFGLFPPIPLLLTALLLWKFPLGRAQHAELRAAIAAKHGG